MADCKSVYGGLHRKQLPPSSLTGPAEPDIGGGLALVLMQKCFLVFMDKSDSTRPGPLVFIRAYCRVPE